MYNKVAIWQYIDKQVCHKTETLIQLYLNKLIFTNTHQKVKNIIKIFNTVQLTLIAP